MRHHRLAQALALAFTVPLAPLAWSQPNPTAAPGEQSVAPALAHPEAAKPAAAGSAATPPSTAIPGALASPTRGELPVKSLGMVTVQSSRPRSQPTQLPTTVESLSAEQIRERINANDSEDVLKYFPSLLVRKRYVGDYNHAILSSRASGTGNSARSAVYADGMLLSNYLGNGVGGLSFPPRWGMVTPEEIASVDVMYGPFSAAYPGNSVGAVVDYQTRMPERFEVHGSLGLVSQPFNLYTTGQTDRAWQTSASVGNRRGDWAWLLHLAHTDSHGQPLTFASRVVSSGTAGAAGTAVTGAVADKNTTNAPIYILGTGTEYQTRQDHIKAKLAYDLSPTVRAFYTLGLWHNESEGRPVSYLRQAVGQTVYSGTVNINGRSYALTGADFVLSNESLNHAMHGLSVKSHSGGVWDWELAASRYDYLQDQKRQNAATNPLPSANSGGAGTVADGHGTGWNTLAARGTWRPQGSAHVVDFGAQQDSYQLRYLTANISGNWINDGAGTTASNVGGNTRLQSLYAQDAWAWSRTLKSVLGLRAEQWSADGGYTQIAGTAANSAWESRRERYLSPKAVLAYQWRPDTVLKASMGRAVRMPTVAELYGATSTTNAQYINDPTLKPEKSWTNELSLEKEWAQSLLRVSLFAENTRDALYSQTTYDATANKNISRVQNVGRIQTEGLELAYSGSDVGWRGLDLNASATYAHSLIKENSGFVSVPGDTIGKQQPNIPLWRAAAQASYRWDARWVASLGARYSGPQFRTLDNSDVNGFTYQGVSHFFVVDVRLLHRISKQWRAAFGIDNLANDHYWNFHPYPQRSYVAELQFDL